MAEDKLSKGDLVILMDSYKNNIQLNTTLLEQQKQLIIMTGETITKQRELCSSLDAFIEKVSDCSRTVGNSIKDHDNNVSKEFSTVKFRISLVYGGMVTIILAIVGLAISYTDKFLTLKDLISHMK